MEYSYKQQRLCSLLGGVHTTQGKQQVEISFPTVTGGEAVSGEPWPTFIDSCKE